MSLKICPRCIQYADDCECCTDCGGVECHDHGCSEAVTREIIRPAARVVRHNDGCNEAITREIIQPSSRVAQSTSPPARQSMITLRGLGEAPITGFENTEPDFRYG